MLLPMYQSYSLCKVSCTKCLQTMANHSTPVSIATLLSNGGSNIYLWVLCIHSPVASELPPSTQLTHQTANKTIINYQELQKTLWPNKVKDLLSCSMAKDALYETVDSEWFSSNITQLCPKPHSYMVTTPSGFFYQWNRWWLMALIITANALLTPEQSAWPVDKASAKVQVRYKAPNSSIYSSKELWGSTLFQLMNPSCGYTVMILIVTLTLMIPHPLTLLLTLNQSQRHKSR